VYTGTYVLIHVYTCTEANNERGGEKRKSRVRTFLSSSLYQRSLCPALESDSLARRNAQMPSREWLTRDSESVGYRIPSPATRGAISVVTRTTASHCTHPMLSTYSSNFRRERQRHRRVSFTCDTRNNSL
jgi:hypothetical protein